MNKRNILAVAALVLAVAGTVAMASPASAHGPGGFGRDGFGPGGFGLGRGGERGELLAQELGISVEQLQAAMTRAMDTRLAEAVKNGRLTQEQAELMKAGRKLQLAIDHDAVLAKALGISVADLTAARAAGKDMRALLSELKLDRQTFQTNLQKAMDEAIAQAVKDGVITQAQADALKAARAKHGRGLGGGRGGRGPLGEGTADEGTRMAPAPADQGAGL